MSSTILVTGGAGYIGSQTCKALAKKGFTPVTYDNLSTGHAYAVKWGPFVQGELNDKTRLTETISSFKPIAILHFAGSAIVHESLQDPKKYYRNNMGATLTLLETMKELSVQNIIFSSTCATYGHPEATPITETHSQVPISPYGRTKLMVEEMLTDFASAYDLKTIFLRYFNAAGADLETELGENHTPETHLIPSIIHAALGIKKELVVYGTDFDTKDGSAVRDYIHVQDLADAHVLALEYLLREKSSTTFNLGTGHGFSVFEIIDAIQAFCDKTILVKHENKRAGDPSTLTADNKKAKELLGWVPKHSELPIIIKSAWKWHQLLTQNATILKNAMNRLETKESVKINDPH
jgi:UDP-arabinose 4-epimerase